ncbi:MAG: DNA polymerase IV [candidate division Zixibacteria bacterium]|nr:DNA polymerase IV [candidate division Zixibacteria bacterium]
MVAFQSVILHVDMDAFFAAVEVRNNPKLKGKPVIVGGGIGQRGVVSTCSYEARKYGVKSGMPAGQAQRLCPNGVFISAGLRGYIYASACLQKIFNKYSPVVEPISVDEAFLDITGTERLFGGPEELVYAMKNEIWEEMKLTCSVGIAPGKYLAKLASGINKPDGMTILDRDRFKAIFFPLPVDSLWGVGESTKRTLNRQGVFTVGDLAATDATVLKRIFGINGGYLSVMSRGEDTSSILGTDEAQDDKSMSHETTVSKDIQDPTIIKATVLWLSDKVSRRMRRRGFVGRTVSVKIRSSDFFTITRSHTLSRPTDRSDVLYYHAMKLIPREFGMKFKVRLLGVRMSELSRRDRIDDVNYPDSPDLGQLDLSLFDDEVKTNRLTKAVDSIRDKYGEGSVLLAGTLCE